MFQNLRKRLFEVLRKTKHKISPPDSPRDYERRLRKELARVERVFAGAEVPVLIHTYGKVGSTALHTAISRLSGFGSFQTHFISEEGVRNARRIHLEQGRDPIHLKVGEALSEALKRHPEKQVKVVTLVREPVARAVSDLFENPTLLVPGEDIRTLPLERLVEIAAAQVLDSLDYTETWFDRELSGVLGFDFFGRPFDQESGFSIYRLGRFELIAGKLEQLSRRGGRAFGEFLGRDRELEIPKSRARSATGEASLYEQVRGRLRLPGDVLDRVYASRVCRHFYHPEELATFRKQWIQ